MSTITAYRLTICPWPEVVSEAERRFHRAMMQRLGRMPRPFPAKVWLKKVYYTTCQARTPRLSPYPYCYLAYIPEDYATELESSILRRWEHIPVGPTPKLKKGPGWLERQVDKVLAWKKKRRQEKMTPAFLMSSGSNSHKLFQ